MTEPILFVRDLTAHYGKTQVLFGVSLEVFPGELVALIGANGSGKTTLLRAVSGWLRPTGGEVRFEGRPITGLTADQVVRLGMAQCPEGRRVFPFLTVWENLRMGAYVRRDNWRADVEELLERFPRLRERLHQMAGTLSGGEQQMLVIARALLSRPRLLLLDEPSLGLAPMMVEQVMEVIRSIRQRGITVLLVEQNAMMALQMADRGYVLETGRVVRTGPGPELVRDPEIRKAYLGVH